MLQGGTSQGEPTIDYRVVSCHDEEVLQNLFRDMGIEKSDASMAGLLRHGEDHRLRGVVRAVTHELYSQVDDAVRKYMDDKKFGVNTRGIP